MVYERHTYVPGTILRLRCIHCGKYEADPIHQMGATGSSFIPIAPPTVSFRNEFTHKDINFLKLISMGVSYESWIGGQSEHP